MTTYAYPGLPPLTWHHVGHANLMSFLKRLGATFPTPGKLIVAGSSAGGFGALANYPAFRWYWKDAKSYLVDDSGPPLVGDAVPADSRAKWYQNWGMGSTLDAFCKECRTDMSAGMANLKKLYPDDRIALLSYVQDLTIREFFGTFTITPPSVTPMDATSFETELRLLGSTIVDPPATSGNARYFFTKGTGHPLLIPDPSAIATPSPGLAAWLELMLSDDTTWASATD